MTEMVEQLAQTARGAFEHKTRDDGSTYWARKDDAPEWVQELCMHAHDGMFPDDFRYQFIVDALDVIIDGGELEPDVYNAKLVAWLGSNLNRAGYVEDAVADLGWPDAGLFTALQYGQLREMEEVAALVQEFLDDLEEDDEEEEA